MHQFRLVKCNNRRQILEWKEILINANIDKSPFCKGDDKKKINSWFKDQLMKLGEFASLDKSYYAISIVDLEIGRVIYEMRVKNY